MQKKEAKPIEVVRPEQALFLVPSPKPSPILLICETSYPLHCLHAIAAMNVAILVSELFPPRFQARSRQTV